MQRFDGIQVKKKTVLGPRVTSRVVLPVVSLREFAKKSRGRPMLMGGWPKLRRLQVLGVLALVLVSFATGLWAMWQTGLSFAGEQRGGRQTETPPGQIALTTKGAFALGPTNLVPNEVLYNMSLSQLEYYFSEGYKTPEMREQELLTTRTEKLRQYFNSKKSPLVTIADTLAGLKHWRLVIAISNSESSLGKRCKDNNCSGIGVDPSHPLWREYETKADWAKDLDALIEKRYKDWTLDEMNGVYNNPGSHNWVFAASQVLYDLQEIE